MPCPSGRHGKAVPAKLTQCYPCGLGAFSSTPGATACETCSLDTISGVVDNATMCKACTEGSIRDPNRVFCTRCDVGKRKVLSADKKRHTCDGCPSAKYAAAGSANCSTCKGGAFPDKARGSCLRCSSGAYRAYDDDCSTCPTVGVDCEGSALQVRSLFFLSPFFVSPLPLTPILTPSHSPDQRRLLAPARLKHRQDQVYLLHEALPVRQRQSLPYTGQFRAHRRVQRGLYGPTMRRV